MYDIAVVKLSNCVKLIASTMDAGHVTLIGSTICVMLTLQFSIQLVVQHYLSWNTPKEQKAIVVIVLMAPLYAIDSYAGLIGILGSPTFFTFLESVKECYEAVVSLFICNLATCVVEVE